MKNKIFLLVSFLLSISNCFSQIAYYDALELSKYVDKTHTPHTFKGDAASLKIISGILDKYYTNLHATNWDDIQSTLYDSNEVDYNPILKPYLNVSVGLSASKIQSNSLFASVGNVNVTNFADGLAKFLVERSKEELNVAFFRKFQEFVKGYPEMQIIFPTTYDFVQKIYSYQYAAMLPALRVAFQKDMNSFSSNMIKLRNLTTRDCRATDKECATRIASLHNFLNNDHVGKTLVAALIVSDNLIKGNNAAEILDAIATDEICIGQSDNFSNIIRFSNLISNSLRNTIQGKIWISKNELNQLLIDDDAMKIYLGLLYAKDKMESPNNIIFTTAAGTTLSLQNLLIQANDNAAELLIFKNNLKNVGYAAAAVSSAAENVISQKKEDLQSSIMAYGEYVSTVSDFLKFTVSFFNTENPQIANDLALFITIIDDAVNSCYDVKSQNYSALVLHTSNILATILNGNYSFEEKYIKYGTFMANIVEAKSSDEVKAAIEAAVLPVGSSSIKRETDFNISLNAYIGPFAGYEYMPTLKDKQWAFSYGVTAPVGIAFSWGNIGKFSSDRKPKTRTKKDKSVVDVGGKSFTIFVPLIDVGAVAAFRAGDDGSKVASEVTLSNIISPGLFFYWGFGKCPVSVGVGAQLGPQLREVTATDINVDKNYYVRYGVNLVVDIPFFNLYTKN